jgi:hypothetical protein
MGRYRRIGWLRRPKAADKEAAAGRWNRSGRPTAM